jgi:uncharacterized protein YkwD
MFASLPGLTLCLSLLLPAAENAAAPQLLPAEQNLIYYANLERQQYALPLLRADADLVDSARRHAYWMASRQSLVHTTAPVAENIAMGQPSSRDAVRDWMNSPGHRANLLHSGYTRVGASAYTTSAGTTYWCIQFLR